MLFLVKSTTAMCDRSINDVSDEQLKNMKIQVIGYHSHCRDGHCSQIIARDYYGKFPRSDTFFIYWGFNPSTTVKHIESMFKYINKNFPNIPLVEFISFDVAFEYSDYNLLCAFTNVTIVDHHISSKRDFDKHASTDDFIFDNNECGATLAWKYFYPGTAVPKLIEYVKDRDLWKFEQPNSHEVNEWIHAYAPDYSDTAAWLKFFKMTKEEESAMIENAVLVGKSLLEMKNKMIRSIMRNSCIVDDDGNRICAVNSCILQSEVGNYAVEQRDENGDYTCDYAIIWRYDQLSDGSPNFDVSFRSRNNSVDVSVVAARFGGGGHHSAAGCKIADINTVVSLF